MSSRIYFYLFYNYDNSSGIKAEYDRSKKYFLILLSPLFQARGKWDVNLLQTFIHFLSGVVGSKSIS